MSTLAFRNVDGSPSEPVETWPYEGIVAAIERGSLPDWRRLAVAVEASPWGRMARAIEEYATYGEERAVAALLTRRASDAREADRARDEAEVARRMRQAVVDSGLTAAAFARECGTSATRLSTYCTGKVQPSAAMLLRCVRRAERLGSVRGQNGVIPAEDSGLR